MWLRNGGMEARTIRGRGSSFLFDDRSGPKPLETTNRNTTSGGPKGRLYVSPGSSFPRRSPRSAARGGTEGMLDEVRVYREALDEGTLDILARDRHFPGSDS